MSSEHIPVIAKVANTKHALTPGLAERYQAGSIAVQYKFNCPKVLALTLITVLTLFALGGGVSADENQPTKPNKQPMSSMSDDDMKNMDQAKPNKEPINPKSDSVVKNTSPSKPNNDPMNSMSDSDMKNMSPESTTNALPINSRQILYGFGGVNLAVILLAGLLKYTQLKRKGAN